MTSYLLDTHTFLWFINDDESLSATARGLVESLDSNIFLSTASRTTEALNGIFAQTTAREQHSALANRD